MAGPEALFDVDPGTRLAAARGLSRRSRRRWSGEVTGWPPTSPGSLNAWLLFVTNKPPTWRDPLHPWRDVPPTLGEPHEGFLYPDPIGFWDEVRRWSLELFQQHEPEWNTGECLSLTALVHVGDDPTHLEAVWRCCHPRLVVFLDEAAWSVAGLDVPIVRSAIPDPHRAGQGYEGWWGEGPEGVVVGKAPQHPTMHRLYDAGDLTGWLRAAPTPRRP